MKKVLLLDDNDDAILLQTVILESDGFTVESGRSGIEGLEKLKSFNPDIIVSDVLMPEMDGFQFCRAVKSDKHLKHIPIVFYSAQYTDKEDRALAEDIGAEGFIYKPIDMDKFLSTINRILEQDKKREIKSHKGDVPELFEQKHYEVQAKMLDKKLHELETEHFKLKESEDELRRINEHLNELVKEESEKIIKNEIILMQQSKMAAMGEMIGMIAHQWRQPLNAISTASIRLSILNEFGELTPEELDKTLKFIQEILQNMSTTINDFMNFAKPEREKELFFVKDALNEAVNMINAQLATRGIALIIDVEDGIQLFGYIKELVHVLINCLANARDAFDNMDKDDKTIVIRASNDNNYISIRISDNAGGINDDIINRIFEPFFTTKITTKGTGLGLYISRKIIQEHFQGMINASNKEGGAEFKIDLLVQQGDERSSVSH
jgi:signal transduction histidine kinase